MPKMIAWKYEITASVLQRNQRSGQLIASGWGTTAAACMAIQLKCGIMALNLDGPLGVEAAEAMR
jgi:hypothetical protein